jgi:hypothetical protein
MKHLFTLTGAIEAGAGLALLAAPAAVVQLLLGAEIAGAAIPLARVARAALLALGVACWLARGDSLTRGSRGLVAAMLLYNFCTVAVLGEAGIRSSTAGAVLWLAVILHGAMAAWCVLCFLRRQENVRSSQRPPPDKIARRSA